MKLCNLVVAVLTQLACVSSNLPDTVAESGAISSTIHIYSAFSEVYNEARVLCPAGYGALGGSCDCAQDVSYPGRVNTVVASQLTLDNSSTWGFRCICVYPMVVTRVHCVEKTKMILHY